jgi:hypothetical protein
MYTVWHVDKYKITFKLVISLTNEILLHIVVSWGLSRSGVIDTRARYRAAARRLRNTGLGRRSFMKERNLLSRWGAVNSKGRTLFREVISSTPYIVFELFIQMLLNMNWYGYIWKSFNGRVIFLNCYSQSGLMNYKRQHTQQTQCILLWISFPIQYTRPWER